MEYLIDGFAWTLALNGVVGLGAYWTARHGLREPKGVARALTTALLGWAWITLGMQLIGPFGGLARGPLLAWSGGGLLIGVICRRRSREIDDPPVKGPAEKQKWGWDATASLALVLWPLAIQAARSLVLPVKVMSDGPIYHLWFAARWWQEGRLFLVAAPFGESVVTYFPCNGDLWFAWLMVGWGGGELAKIGQVFFLPIVGLTVADMAIRLGVGRSAAAVAACWALTLTPLLAFTVEPNVDTIFVAGYLLAAWCFLRFAQGEADLKVLALGALAAGACWGTKPSGLVFVPPILAIVGLFAVVRPGSIGRRIARLGVLALGPMVLAGYWYAGNAWRSGNPLYPLQLELFGRTLLVGWHDASVMRQSTYYIDPRDLGALWDMVLQTIDPRLAPAWAIGLIGGLIGSRAAGRPERRLGAVVAGMALLNLAIYWLAIPYRTQQRFMFQGVALMAVPLGCLLDRSRALRWGAVGLLALHVLTPMAWPWAGANDPAEHAKIPWDRSEFVPNSLPGLVQIPELGRLIDLDRLDVRSWLSIVSGVLAGVAAVAIRRAINRPSRSGFPGAAAALAVLVVSTSLLTFPWGTKPADRFYAGFPDYYLGWRTLDRIARPEGSRIAYAGTNLPYYLLGPGLANRVRYINVDAHPSWLMHDYHRRAVEEGRPNWPDPRPPWDRERPDEAGWLASLDAERIDLLVVARHNVGEPWPIERQWADGRPDRFAPAYGEANSDPLFRIYAFRGANNRDDRTDRASARH